MHRALRFVFLPAILATSACSSGPSSGQDGPLGKAAEDVRGRGHEHSRPQDVATTSSIAHLVVVIQENHSFDTYFGRYCTAPSGSNPSCTEGPACCEAGPSRDPSGASPVTLSDKENESYDPRHTRACETA